MSSVVFTVAIWSLLALFSLCTADLALEYNHFAALDELENYKLYWSVDRAEKSISFAVEVRTTGWVGFGISSGNGKMKGSDLVIGWVKDCKGYLTDRYADGYSVPVLDKQQDYELTGFSEKDGTTVLKFKRKIDTCDVRDRKIEEGTTKVVFGYNPSDPNSPMDLRQHSVKGQRSLMLLNSWQGSASLPKDMKYFDVLMDKVQVPGNDTTYWCRPVKLPTFDKKYHIVKIEPVIQEGHKGLVHHVLAYNCKSSFNESGLFYSGRCYHPNMPDDVMECNRGALAAAWAIGSEGFVYPDDVGAPIGDADSPKVILLEMHYDNPLEKTDYVDSSGLRFFYTEPRKYDSAVLMTGLMSTRRVILIPPKQKSWLTTGYCPKRCTKAGFADKGGVKVFAAFLHTHLTGRKIWTKHIRDGRELPEIARDDNYDFNFQETQHLNKEVTILPGDELITDCVYNTMDRTGETVGGIRTRDEMCLSFLLYYPRSNLSYCITGDLTATRNFAREYGLTNKTAFPLTWNQTMAEKLKQLYNESPNSTAVCTFSGPSKALPFFTVVKPKITTPLPKPDLNCTATGKNTSAYMDPGTGYCVSGAGGLGTGLTSMLSLGITVLLIVSKMAM